MYKKTIIRRTEMVYSNTSKIKIQLGLSLLEFLVAIAIVAILLALLLPAVQKIRLSASVTREKNKVKQIALAIHMYADNHDRIGSVRPLAGILPFLEQGAYYEIAYPNGFEDTTYETIKMPPYLNQDDPSLYLQEHQVSSYVINGLIHINFKSKRLAIIRDGMSNTIEITTHYANIRRSEGNKMYRAWKFWNWPIDASDDPVELQSGNMQRLLVTSPPTFANPRCRDVLPGSVEAQSVTFQLRPKIEEADPRIPQSPYTHGLLAGLADGSVRMISPQISPQTFWAAVSPNGGEVLGPDW